MMESSTISLRIARSEEDFAQPHSQADFLISNQVVASSPPTLFPGQFDGTLRAAQCEVSLVGSSPAAVHGKESPLRILTESMPKAYAMNEEPAKANLFLSFNGYIHVDSQNKIAPVALDKCIVKNVQGMLFYQISFKPIGLRREA